MVLSADEWGILWLSLKVAVVATLVAAPIAVLAAWMLSRARFPGKSLVNAALHLPLVLPPVVTGYALLVLFGRQGALGGPLAEWFGFTFAFRWTGAALAAAVMGFPLMVRAIRLAMDGVDARLEDAAATLGAGPVRRFLSVTLPLAAPGVLAGMVLAFAKALGEFGATITFVSNIPGETRTLSLALYTLAQTPGAEAAIWRLIALSVGVSFIALVASDRLAGRMHAR